MSETNTNDSKSKQTDILVCIPTYNAESAVGEAVTLCKEFADSVVVINDGSSDNSEFVAREAGADVITHKKNWGYGGAIKTALEEGLKINAKVTVTFDADLQHDAKDIPKITKSILSNDADIVIGSRFLEKNIDIKTYRKFGRKFIISLVRSFSGNKIKDAESGFRGYDLESLK